MKWLMRRCTNCSRYTLKAACPSCGGPTVIPHPVKFSPEDKYARYRIKSPGTDST
ncbi:RNA-protein complex protein Nop10 [Candidatus Bathyarchaeota archaeon]|nr:RNA-protein complex protein Nop10 [Candidatus Bathyarchaeota archaeon]